MALLPNIALFCQEVYNLHLTYNVASGIVFPISTAKKGKDKMAFIIPQGLYQNVKDSLKKLNGFCYFPLVHR